jgi:threonine dehydratase
MAAYLKARNPGVMVLGATPRNSNVMAASVRAGKLLELPSTATLSDGTAGGVEPGAITYPLCRELVDDWYEASEDKIAHAMRHCLLVEHLLVEGAAGVAIAALTGFREKLRDRRVAVILCGANVSAETLRSVLHA